MQNTNGDNAVSRTNNMNVESTVDNTNGDNATTRTNNMNIESTLGNTDGDDAANRTNNMNIESTPNNTDGDDVANHTNNTIVESTAEMTEATNDVLQNEEHYTPPPIFETEYGEQADNGAGNVAAQINFSLSEGDIFGDAFDEYQTANATEPNNGDYGRLPDDSGIKSIDENSKQHLKEQPQQTRKRTRGKKILPPKPQRKRNKNKKLQEDHKQNKKRNISTAVPSVADRKRTTRSMAHAVERHRAPPSRSTRNRNRKSSK